MRDLRLLILSGALALVACGGSDRAVAGDNAREPAPAEAVGAGGTRSFDADGFEKVELRGPDDVNVRVGPAFSVRASGPEAALAELEVTVVDGELRLGRERRSWGSGSSEGRIRFEVTMPRIVAASIAGAGDLTIDRAEAPAFSAGIAGAGNLSIGALTTGKADLSIAGAGDIAVAGRADRVEISVAGAGEIDADRLVARTAKISSVGAGDIALSATETVAISLLGAGDVEISGTAQCKTSKMGAGEVRCGG